MQAETKAALIKDIMTLQQQLRLTQEERDKALSKYSDVC
jgi:hypothetical protein